MSCSLTYCGGSLIQCKTVIKNNLLFLENWGRKGVQNGAANKKADYYSQETMRAIHLCLPLRAIHLCLPFFVILLIGEAADLCIEHFAFRVGYHTMAFQLPCPPRVSFASHNLSPRQLVNVSQMMTLRPQHIWSHSQGLHRTLGALAPIRLRLQSTLLVQSVPKAQVQHHQVSIGRLGPCSKVGTCRNRITTKCTWKDMRCGVRGT